MEVNVWPAGSTDAAPAERTNGSLSCVLIPGKGGGMVTGSTSTSPENGAGIEYALSTLRVFTCQMSAIAPEDSRTTQAEHPTKRITDDDEFTTGEATPLPCLADFEGDSRKLNRGHSCHGFREEM